MTTVDLQYWLVVKGKQMYWYSPADDSTCSQKPAKKQPGNHIMLDKCSIVDQLYCCPANEHVALSVI